MALTNGDVLIKTLFRLDIPDPGKVIEIYDEIDYAGAGEDINNFVGVLDISGPNGTIYENTDFGDPDIVPATSRKVNKDIHLILDPQNEYWPLQGNYTIRYTVQNTVTLDEYYQTFVYSFQFDKPTMDLDVDSGPYSANLRSTDLTDYGSDAQTITREHRLKYPPLAPGGPYPDVVSTLAFVELTTVYTNVWEVSVKTTVNYYQAGDELYYDWYGETETEHCVYGACLDAMYDAMDTMYQQYLGYLGVNKVQADLYKERLIRVNSAELLLEIAWRNNDVEEADKQAAIIHEVLEISGIQGCDPSGASALVSPCPAWGGGGITPPSYTFQNGLNESGGDVGLGGTLIENTTINAGAYSFTVQAIDSGAAQFTLSDTQILNSVEDPGTSASRVILGQAQLEMGYYDLVSSPNSRRYIVDDDGLKEFADYSSGYVPLSLVNKDYVDNAIAGIGTYTFQDGLTEAAGVVSWGGTISETVDFDGSGWIRFGPFTGDSGVDFECQVDIEGTVLLYSTSTLSMGGALQISTGFLGITDDRGTKEGLTYNADYSGSFVDRSLVDKAYVDDAIAGAATNFLDLTDTPSSYSGAADYFVRVNGSANGLVFTATGGWVPDTGGTFTGVLTINVDNDYPLIIKQAGAAGTPGTPDALINRIRFQDSDGDNQGYVGIDGSGNISLYTGVSGGVVQADNSLNVVGNITLTGTVDTVDIAAFKTAYDAHVAAANPHGTNMEDLADVPAYSGNQYKIPRINVTEDAIEWVTATDSDKYYLHVQGAASATWNIAHNLGKYPSVTIMDDSGNIIEADGIQHTDLNNTIITFTSAVDGQAAFN